MINSSLKVKKIKAVSARIYLRQNKCNHPLALGSSPVSALWRTVDLQVQSVIRDDSHSLAWETLEPCVSGEQSWAEVGSSGGVS